MSCEIQPARQSQQYNTMQHHTILCNDMKDYAISYDAKQYHAVPYDAMQYNGIICIFGPKKGHFGQSGPRNGPPSGQTAIYRKTEGIQSYLRICGCYDLIESGLSEPKKRDFMGVAQKNLIFGPKMGSCSPPGGRSAT